MKVYFGIRTFFARLVGIVGTMTFAVVHTLTDFNTDPYSAQAIWGIRVHAAIIPMICILFGALIFWLFYDLKPKRIVSNQEKIKEIGL